MGNAAIATPEEVLDYLEYANFRLTTAKISTTLPRLVRARIASWVTDLGAITFASIEALSDDNEFVWAASLCMYLEYLCQRGQVQQSSGNVESTRLGDLETHFQRDTPMFFFAQGMAEKFYALLSHDTYRMQAYEFMTKWRNWYFDTVIKEVRFGTTAARMNMDTGEAEFYTSGGDV